MKSFFVLLSFPLAARASETLTIDFGACAKTRTRVDGPQGSATFEVLGKKSGNCLFDWDSEIETPGPVGALRNHCAVPTKLGVVVFPKTGNAGLNLDSIKKYCRK